MGSKEKMEVMISLGRAVIGMLFTALMAGE